MKKINVKYLLITAVAVICIALGERESVLGQTITSPSAPSPLSLQQQKFEIRDLVGSVKYERNRIASLRAKYNADRKKGDQTAMLEDKKQLTRANGDLKMAKAYLKAEKDLFLANHNLAIQNARETVRHDRRMLSKSKVILNNDLAALDDKSNQDAMEVVKYERKLARDKEILSQKIIDKNNDILAINKKIKKQNGEFVGTLYAENVAAATKKWVEK